MKRIVIALLLFTSIYAIGGKKKKDIPVAPLPTIVINAKKFFLPMVVAVTLLMMLFMMA